MTNTTAHCGRDGVIRFCLVGCIPVGNLTIATAPRTNLDRVFDGLARHAYDGETRLVPGIPEATDGDAAISALIAFCQQVTKALRKEAAQ